ncbi:U-Kazal-Dg21.2-like isoform X2 [Rhodnius prolixus]|uniref:Uncharacterized protein n=1 Tax=Rhodnius prolixus TaxID=13249 RepID=T1I0I7_RHOPR
MRTVCFSSKISLCTNTQGRANALCLVKLAEGQQQCNIPCTGEYNPVCGQQNDFFRIFSNRCRLERENFCGANPRWNFVRVGQCP